MSQHRIERRTYSATGGYAPRLTPFTFAGHTIACERHPDRNEDSIVIDEQNGMAAVFDGVGGSAAGEIASQTAARATRQRWLKIVQHLQKNRKVQGMLENCNKVELAKHIDHLIKETDEQIRTEGAMRAGTDDLATTVVFAVLCRQSAIKGYTMMYAHVGDSRLYLLREGEHLQRLTSDDGLLAKLVENQIVSETDARRIDQAMYTSQLNDMEFSYFRLRGGITQALGGPIPPTIHINHVSIFPGDRVLLCTDGIHDNLTDDEIEEILRSSTRTTVTRMLVEHALRRSRQDREVTVRAKPDDMSAIVLTCRFS